MMSDIQEAQVSPDSATTAAWRTALGGFSRECLLRQTKLSLGFELKMPPEDLLTDLECCIGIRSGLFEWQLAMSRSTACALVAERWHPWIEQSSPQPPAEIMQLVWESGLEPLLADLSEFIGREVSFLSVQTPPVAAGLQTLSSTFVNEKGDQLRWVVFADDPAMEILAQAWGEQPLKSVNQLSELPLEVVMEFGWREFSMSDLRTLSPGDVVVLDYETDEQPGIVGCVRVENCGRFNARLNERQASIISPVELELLEPDIMDEMDNEDWTKELPVTLTFEAGRCSLPLNELEAVKPGYCFELPNGVGQSLKITVNGRVIGEGELVKLSAGYGVRLKQIGLTESESS